MKARYQNGTVYTDKRRNIVYFKWWEGKTRRTRCLGKGRINRADLSRLVSRLREEINGNSKPQGATLESVAERWMIERMSQRHSTRSAYLANLNNHILPRWGASCISELKGPEAEQWLKTLGLSPKTQSHIKNLMVQLYDHARFLGMIESGDFNPFKGIRIKGSSKRERQPTVLTLEEIEALLAELEQPQQMMVLMAVCLGLRCSELFGLQWGDVDWKNLTINVQRAIVAGRVDDVKTHCSAKRLPLDPALAKKLLAWRRIAPWAADGDWMWASPYSAGEKPYYAWGVQQMKLRPAAKKLGLSNIGWHSFRHTYSSMLHGSGAPLKVQQDLLRHADMRTTMNIYTQSVAADQRKANSKVVRMVLPA